jgi:FAD binding domain
MPFTAPLEDEVPVLIVGGGGAGLTASMLLAVQGVEHLLVSARPTTSDLPKAHVLNQRAMEVLDDVDVAEAIAQRSTPAEQMAATAEHNLELLRRMWSGRSQDAELRSNALRVMRAQSMEFSELGVEYGYSYESEAVLPDGNLPPEPIDDIRVYEPSTRPGAPLPHAWAEDEDGNRLPIKDLVRPGRFLLIAGEDGHPWCEEARHLAAAANLPLDAVRIGHLDGDLFDPRCAWLRYRQIATDGAILVRPDRFVAWRALSACTDPQSVLADALGQILARPIDAIVGTAGVR